MDWAQFDKGVFLVNVLGIVYDKKTKTVLIGKRVNDPYIRELSWVFLGGRPRADMELEDELKNVIKQKSNVNVRVVKTVFAKTYPEKREFLSIYYLCEYVSGKEKVGDTFVEYKWVKPTEVKNYFTTSLHPGLLAYLKTLE